MMKPCLPSIPLTEVPGPDHILNCRTAGSVISIGARSAGLSMVILTVSPLARTTVETVTIRTTERTAANSFIQPPVSEIDYITCRAVEAMLARPCIQCRANRPNQPIGRVLNLRQPLLTIGHRSNTKPGML